MHAGTNDEKPCHPLNGNDPLTPRSASVKTDVADGVDRAGRCRERAEVRSVNNTQGRRMLGAGMQRRLADLGRAMVCQRLRGQPFVPGRCDLQRRGADHGRPGLLCAWLGLTPRVCT